MTSVTEFDSLQILFGSEAPVTEKPAVSSDTAEFSIESGTVVAEGNRTKARAALVVDKKPSVITELQDQTDKLIRLMSDKKFKLDLYGLVGAAVAHAAHTSEILSAETLNKMSTSTSGMDPKAVQLNIQSLGQRFNEMDDTQIGQIQSRPLYHAIKIVDTIASNVRRNENKTAVQKKLASEVLVELLQRLKTIADPKNAS